MANDLDITPSGYPAGVGIGTGRESTTLVELQEAIDLVDQQVRPGLVGQRDDRVEGRPVGSIPVGLWGALTTMSRVAGVTCLRSRSMSIAQPDSSRSSWSVTSAPAARATSYRL